MRLLDVATVVTTDSHFPTEGDSRACAVDIVLQEVCVTDPTGGIVVDATGDGDSYRFEPFGIIGTFTRRVACARDDDKSWFENAVKDATERALGRALVTKPYDEAEVWLGGAAVTETAGVAAARAAWRDHHVGPMILHVAPSDLPGLVDGDVVKVSDDGKKHFTVWGDPVVVNDGYEKFPAFWTGEITIHLSSVQSDAMVWREIRANRMSYQFNRVATIDTPPCAIVRTGPMPA